MGSRQATARPPLSREAVAAALALAGVRAGAHVLDLAPGTGLGRAAAAAAGPAGRVDPAHPDPAHPDPAGDGPRPHSEGTPEVRYGHAIGVLPGASVDEVAALVARARPLLAPYARVLLGTVAPLPLLVQALRAGGWTVLHGLTLEADTALLPPGDPAEVLTLVTVRRAE